MAVGLIYQPCGLGDILFLQKIAYKMQDLGYEVYWPVISELEWLNDYIPNFNFVSWDDSSEHLTGPPLPGSVKFPHKEVYSPDTPTNISSDLYYFQGFINCSPIMAGKYVSIGEPWEDWSSYIKFERNTEKEDDLFYNVLNLKDEDEYVFTNRNYATRPHVLRHPSIPSGFDLPEVEMQILDGFSIFDWCKVIERSHGIYMIESALNYVLESDEMFDTIANKHLELFHRNGNFSEVDYLFKLPWKYR
jgi:hypothetical protein